MPKTLKNTLVYSLHDTQLHIFAERYISGKLIDIGCGTKPYKNTLAPFVSEHIGVDHLETFHDKQNIDLFGTAYDIPVEDESFDSAISTAVLEHLEEPEKAIQECYRILKSGGYAIYSIPFLWHLHEEPRDFYRYSKYGIEYLFEKVGFKIIEIKPLSGFWVTFGQLFVYYIYRFNRGPLRWLHIIDFVGLLIQGIAYGLDKIDKAEQWTWMYMVVVQKP
jgi:ubiquinone/menaquinone biosynthesis C-methylase UbiE